MSAYGLVNNMSTISYKFTPGNGVAPYSLNSDSNTATTYINNANIDIYKSVDKTNVDLLDVITYTIILTNTGSVDADNVLITDTIPSGAIYKQNTLTIDGISKNDNPNTGITIESVPPNTPVVVIFQCDVTSIPSNNEIINSAVVSYNYAVDTENIKSISTNSNSVTTQVKHANINIDKVVDRQIADIGDILTYTLTVSNSGNTKADNIVVNDILPNEIIYQSDSIYIDSVHYSGDLSSGVAIGTIDPTKSVIIKFKCSVVAVPNPNEIINYSTAEYTYTIDIGNIKSSTTTSNNVSTQINHGSLIITKSVLQEYSDLSDVIDYTINVTNNGTVSVSNITVTDILPNGATYNNNTLLIDNNPSSYNPNTGIMIDNIDVDQTVVIQFSCTISSIPTLNPMLNKANTTFKYNVNAQLEKSGNTSSNTTDTTVNHAQLLIKKSSSIKYITILDTIKYTILVTNTGNTKADNIIIIDTLESSLQFIDGTITLDGVYHEGNPNTGIEIGSIDEKQSITLEFEVVVDNIPNGNKISNVSVADYDYTVNPSNINGKTASSISNIADIEFVDIYLLIEYLLEFLDEYMNTCDETSVVIQKEQFIELLDKTLYVLQTIEELELGNNFGIKSQIERMKDIITELKTLMQQIKPVDSCENILMDSRLRVAVIDVVLQVISSLELLNGIQVFYIKCPCYVTPFVNAYVNSITKLYTITNTFKDIVGLNNSISYNVNIKPYIPAYSPSKISTNIQMSNKIEFACYTDKNSCKD